MKIALAQMQSRPGTITATIDKHIRYIQIAAASHANAIFFPELSLLNYEPSLASQFRMEPDALQLSVFRELSAQYRITIGLGIPLADKKKTKIAMAIFQPGKPVTVYAKQFLHEDEKPYFSPGYEQIIIKVENDIIAPAICYEGMVPEHLEKAVGLGASVYLVSVAKDENGVQKAYDYFPEQARKYQIPILMCNAVGRTDTFISAGGSAVWNAKGERVGVLSSSESILIYNVASGMVEVQTIA